MALAPGSISSYNIAPGQSQADLDYKRKIAYALMQQASSGEPIQHWAQGLAKLGQGALGGYELYRSDQADQQDKAGTRAIIASLMGGAEQAAPQAATPAPQRPPVMAALGAQPEATATPRAPVQSSARVMGDQEAIDNGYYDPMPGERRTPQSVVAQGHAAAGQPVGGLPADRRQQLIGALMQTRAGAAMGQTLFTKELEREANRVRPLTDPAERAKFGIQATDTNPYQVDATGKISPVNPQPFAVNVNQQQESEFKKKAGSLQAERFNDLATEGTNARQLQSDISTLRDLGEKIRTGKIAEFKGVIGPYADALGIKIDGLSEIQAFEAVVNRAAPQMRVKGTGAQSDFELKNFFKQFPSIGNTPEGNALVDRTLSGFVQNKIAASEIGAEALAGNITAKEAEKRLRELPDPLAEWREFNKKNAPMKPTKVRTYNPATGKIE